MSLKARPLCPEVFANFGDVLTLKEPPDAIINQGLCERHHNLARIDFFQGNAGISLFKAQARHWPVEVALLERHPLGSQAFLPLGAPPFLVVVAEDQAGQPTNPQAFVTAPGQGINLLRGTWHGVLCPLGANGIYGVVDRIGDGQNLEEHWLATPLLIHPPD